VSVRVLACVALLPLAGSAHAGALVPVDAAHGWCAVVTDGDCREYALAEDPSLRIVHFGFEDGMRFDLFRRRGRRYSHQLSFVAVRPVTGRPGHYDRLDHAEGFAPAVDDAGGHATLRYSFALTLEDDMGEMPADRWQKRVPAILFEPADGGMAIEGEPHEALAMPFETLTVRQAIRRSRQARMDCPSTTDRVVPCP
jgi:hypothetical protein